MHFSKNIYKILSILLIIIFVSLVPVLVMRSIRINKIVCNSQYGLCDQDRLTNLELVKGKDLKRAKNYLDDLLANDLSINDYLVQYKIPSTIDVEINFKKPSFAIYDPSKGYYLVEKDGLIIGFSEKTDLPFIKVQKSNYNLGENLNEKHKFAIDTFSYLLYLYSIKEGTVENESLIVKNSEGVKVILPLEGDTLLLIGSLRLIFSRLNDGSEGIRMNDIREIDLRFKNPVLKQYE